ncbi:amino acid/polyamine/organocation transporter, APC superfamily [Haladaptatus litoreus]|uniref:Amino acid/polyamine/organocation transporter, APC superfamily n=1 Tax=Haladaptatus litoreus TaxID=553468 RepID=A0A1N7CXN5_9EURY|nr:amino acid permease [Haladaptatus litoreus]SIR68300.1 amino acid/polyamine/organocation transporter, APC superfamily [Haladaptatus litoreus]
MSSGDEELAKDLGLLSALTIGIGTMIGAGIFVLPGVAASTAGPIVVVSFVIGGVIAMVNALSVSELGTAMPKAGGGYYYVNRALGPLFGSIAGLGDWIGLAFASAFYSIGFGQYLTTLLPIPGVLFLSDIQIGALIAGAVFVGVNYIGAKETGGVQTVIVLILLSILGIFAIQGWLSFDTSTLLSEGGLAPLGYGAILPGTALIFVSFLGYAKIATVAEELKNPGRNLPLAVIGSVAIVTVIYAILVSIMLGVVPWPELSQSAPLTQAARVAFPGGYAVIAVTIVTLGALLATASSANASILASARINFAMGRDRIVTNWLNEIHPSYATPYRSILVTGAMIIVFIALLGQEIEVLAKAASVLHLVVYALMNAALIVFRETDPEYDPEFTVPLYPITPIVGMILSVGLLAFVGQQELLLSGVFVVGSVIWYFAYARKQADGQGHLSRHILNREEELPDSVVGAAETVAPDGAAPEADGPTTMVALSNPRTERSLVGLAAALAKHDGGRLLATHVIQVPDQTSLAAAANRRNELSEVSEKLLRDARADAEELGVPIETRTILSHEGLDEVFDAAETHDVDRLIMGHQGTQLAGSRAEGTLDELRNNLPCDVLVLNAQEFDPSRVLLPTAGGDSSDLSAEVARALQETADAQVSVLHVADDETVGREFLEEWVAEHDLLDAELLVETGDVETAIGNAAADRSLVVVGATERGLLSRVIGGTLTLSVLDGMETAVLLAERPHSRSLRERLLGR